MSLFQRKNKLTLAVTGMTCGHCEMRVKKALLAIPDVLDAQVSHERDQAVVTIKKNAVKTDDLIAAIQQAGYQASVN